MSAPAGQVPELEPWCGSWIVVSRETGKPVLETFNPRVAGAINLARYEVLTAYRWLVRLNAAIKLAGGGEPDRWHLEAVAAGELRPVTGGDS